MCTIFSRFIKYKGITLGEKPVSNAFADSGKISPWSSEAVNLCRQAGLIQGKGDNLFDPKGNASRAEVATMFMKLINMKLSKIAGSTN